VSCATEQLAYSKWQVSSQNNSVHVVFKKTTTNQSRAI